MINKIGTGVFISLIFIFIFSTLASASVNMSWSFEIFNNPNARQVAHTIAKAQNEMTEEEKDPIADFTDGLERRMQSSVQREIMDMIMDDEEVAAGEYEVGNLIVEVAEDPATGNVILEITNTETGETTIVEYSTDDWPTEYSSNY
ncbi:MAG: curli assembly protein CsgF [Halanaerobiales bacterium]